jgi:hypothetical protein
METMKKNISLPFKESCWLAILCLVFLLPIFGYTQEVMDVSKVTSISVNETSNPKQDLFNKAIEIVTLEHVKILIGEDKTSRNLNTIKNKIIADSGKFILSIRGDQITNKGGQYEMAVAMKISLKGLRHQLLTQGLLYKTEGPPKILPVIVFTDRVNAQSYGWWFQAPATQNRFLQELNEKFHSEMRDQFKSIGFFSMDPDAGKYSNSIPESFKTENLNRSDYLFMGEYFKSSVVLRGQVQLRAKKDSDNIFLIEVKLEAWHASNGRLMAELVRTYETEPGAFRNQIQKTFNSIAGRLAEDLGLQLSDAWKRGTFGASLLKLAVTGYTTPQLLEKFKQEVVIKMRDIKSLRERMIESGRVVYEVDSSALPQELAQSFQSVAFSQFKVKIEDVSTESITLKVQSN